MAILLNLVKSLRIYYNCSVWPPSISTLTLVVGPTLVRVGWTLTMRTCPDFPYFGNTYLRWLHDADASSWLHPGVLFRRINHGSELHRTLDHCIGHWQGTTSACSWFQQCRLSLEPSHHSHVRCRLSRDATCLSGSHPRKLGSIRNDKVANACCKSRGLSQNIHSQQSGKWLTGIPNYQDRSVGNDLPGHTHVRFKIANIWHLQSICRPYSMPSIAGWT